MGYNYEDLEGTIDFADSLEADIRLVYQLIPVGRGSKIRDATLEQEKMLKLAGTLVHKQRDVRTIVEPVTMPQFWPYILKREGKEPGRLAHTFFHGCTDGRGLVYIKANGDVWPCPFVAVSAGNVREKPFDEIWRNSEVFKKTARQEQSEGQMRSM